ncbi:pimeloyl-ACP methyl ester carboxylesterase [Methanomicrobium sp. W14]|uniref:alpha/beta hydrolase n=1 Tax=Methanomicrobium sp. W14 TaxID=2817839 RepID=UPI001AE4C1D9|nr:alpha/beta hydrolase [Methanomicrobium sp. W14]MBP2133319.1 pimeloyl-ACP methyl ester carboxylesterase [Methanomicrobium sp. W14]
MIIRQKLRIGNIPSVLWGETSERLIIAVHGMMSLKEDEIIRILAEEAVIRGYQVLSFDLPEHGDRKDENYPFSAENSVRDLSTIAEYARGICGRTSVFACSIGAYFSLIVFHDRETEQCLFLSPVLDMENLINGMMAKSGITEERLKAEKTIQTKTGETLEWDYYCYVKSHPVGRWDKNTSILYGSKDGLTGYDKILEFSRQNNAGLDVMKEGEHYFHTEIQLSYFRRWIRKNLLHS